MATAPVSPCAAVTARAAQVQLMIFDVDGVLTDGRLTLSETGALVLSFHVHDGQASNYWRGRACRLHSLRAAHRQLSLRARASLASNGCIRVYPTKRKPLPICSCAPGLTRNSAVIWGMTGRTCP